MSNVETDNQEGSEKSSEGRAPKGSYDYLREIYEREFRLGMHVSISDGPTSATLISEAECKIGGACMDLIIMEQEMGDIKVSHAHITKDDNALDLTRWKTHRATSGDIECLAPPSPAFLMYQVRKLNGEKEPKLKRNRPQK